MPRPVNPTLTYDEKDNRLSFDICADEDETVKANVTVYPDPLYADSGLCVAIDQNLCLIVQIEKDPVTGQAVPVVELLNEQYDAVKRLDISTGKDSREKHVQAYESKRAIYEASREGI